MSQLASLSSLLESEAFNPIDRHFADLMRRLSNHDCPALVLAAALVSRRLADGHPCLPLAHFGGRAFPGMPLDNNLSSIVCPSQEEWERTLKGTGLVGQPGECKPLILDRCGRLYLQRFWSYEQTVANDILARLRQPPLALDAGTLTNSLARLFPVSTPGETNWQKLAAFTAVRQRFCVITGGPGTGKTWTVARLLALLLEQPGSESVRIKVAAPTGKAVARLQESLAKAMTDLPCSDTVKARLQAKDLTTTIHRLLGTIPNSVKFRHGRDHPLPAEVLVVDESSMVSLSLMAKLLSALKPDARLVLVGDKDQLPPVDPGGVLGDICRAAEINRFSEDFCSDYKQCIGEALTGDTGPLRGLPDVVVQLRTNYRSGEATALQDLSIAVNEGNALAALRVLRKPAEANVVVALKALPQPKDLKKVLRDAVLAHYGPLLKAGSAAEALTALGRFRILCAVREGPYGVVTINRLVEEILAEARLAPADKVKFGSYPGKPVMVTANNYALKLFNGDTGVVWPDGGGGTLMVHFPEETGLVRAIARERLPEHETIYAMTVHKSQGSEFDRVLLVLPDRESPVLTRELVYTGLTRARQSIEILANEKILQSAIKAHVELASGLSDQLAPQAIPPGPPTTGS